MARGQLLPERESVLARVVRLLVVGEVLAKFRMLCFSDASFRMI
jgi:hypothetical protein